MKSYQKLAAAAILAAGTLALTAGSASAAIVCNAYGSCWHVRHPYAYPRASGIVIHPNGWRWDKHAHYVWREHPGRGYWRNGIWITF